MADILNEAIKLQTLLEQYDSVTTTKFNLMLNNTLDRTIAKLTRMGTNNVGRARLNAMLAETVTLIQSQYTDFNSWLQTDQKAVAELAYNTSAATYTEALASGTATFAKLPESAVKRILDPNRHILGETLKDMQTGLSNNQIKSFKQIIANGVGAGDSTASISKELLAKGDVLRRYADTITKTAIKSASQESYNETASQFDSVIAYAFSDGTLDGRTSPICQKYTSTSWRRKPNESLSDFKARIPDKPPRHANCRSSLIYQSEEQHEFMKEVDKPAVVSADSKTVKHRDGTTSTKYSNKKVEFMKADTTYDEFFSKQSDTFKEGVLGKKRFDLYKQGRLKISQIRDVRSNSYKSIDDIKKLMSDKPIVPKVKVVPKAKVPDIDFGYKGKFNGYVKDIRDDAKSVIGIVKKPLNIKTTKKRGQYRSDLKEVITTPSAKTFIHEYGHHIDHNTIKPMQRGRFTIQPDLSGSAAFKNAYNKDLLDYRYLPNDKLEKILLDAGYEVSSKKGFGISDIMDSMTEGKMQRMGYAGHGRDIFEIDTIKITESFANLFEIWSRKAEWETATKLFPNVTKEFEILMKDVINGKFN